MFDRLNATRILIVLISKENSEGADYLYALFKFMIRILLGGNPTVQKTLYEYFNADSSSEKFFRKILKFSRNYTK